jgi:hypothetical protein
MKNYVFTIFLAFLIVCSVCSCTPDVGTPFITAKPTIPDNTPVPTNDELERLLNGNLQQYPISPLEQLTESENFLYYSTREAIISIDKQSGEKYLVCKYYNAIDLQYYDGKVYFIDGKARDSIFSADVLTGEIQFVLNPSDSYRNWESMGSGDRFKLTSYSISNNKLFIHWKYTYTYDLVSKTGGFDMPWSEALFVATLRNGVWYCNDLPIKYSKFYDYASNETWDAPNGLYSVSTNCITEIDCAIYYFDGYSRLMSYKNGEAVLISDKVVDTDKGQHIQWCASDGEYIYAVVCDPLPDEPKLFQEVAIVCISPETGNIIGGVEVLSDSIIGFVVRNGIVLYADLNRTVFYLNPASGESGILDNVSEIISLADSK